MHSFVNLLCDAKRAVTALFGTRTGSLSMGKNHRHFCQIGKNLIHILIIILPNKKRQNAFNHESHLWLKIPMPFVLYYIIRILSGGAERLTASQIDKSIKYIKGNCNSYFNDVESLLSFDQISRAYLQEPTRLYKMPWFLYFSIGKT